MGLLASPLLLWLFLLGLRDRVAAAQLPVLERLVQVVGGRSARRWLRWMECVPVPFWRRRFRRPKLWRFRPLLRLKLWRIRWLPMDLRILLLPPMGGGVSVTFRNSAAGGLWTATTAWEEEVVGVFKAATKVPGIEDIVNLVKAGGKIELATATTASAKEIQGNAGGNAFENTLKLTGSAILKVAGSLVLSTTTTLTAGSTSKIEISNTAGTAEVNLQGKEAQAFTQNGSGGTVKLAGTMLVAANITVTAGTFNAAAQNVTCLKFEAASVAKLKLESSKIVLTATSGEAWSVVEATTVEAGTSTIEMTGAGETAKKFHGAGRTYNKLVVATDNAEIQGSNTFAELVLNTRGKSVKGTKFEKSQTTSVTSFTTNATEAEKIKIESSLAGKAWNISKVTGTIELTAVELKDSKAEGGATFIDINGHDLTGNTGWTFKHEHTLSVSQPQTVTLTAPKTSARTLTASQAQEVHFGPHTIARTLPTISQAQTPTLAKIAATVRTLTASQAQSPTKSVTLGRALSASQAQVLTLVKAIARTLTVTVGELFFGREVIGATGVNLELNKLSVNRYAKPQSGSIRNLYLRLGEGGGAGTAKFKAIVYADNAGVPGALLAEGTEVTYKNGEGAKWLALPVPALPYSSGSQVWIGFLFGGSFNVAKFFFDAGEANQHRFNARTYAEGAPATWPEGSGTDTHLFSLYAEYTGAPVLSKTVGRALSANQSQSATKSVSISRTLSATQVSSLSLAKVLARTLSASQGSSASKAVASATTLSATQGQSVVKGVVIARTLSASQPQLVTKRVALARGLVVSQGQEASQEGKVEKGGSTHEHTLTLEQGQSVTATRSLARHLSASQGQSVSRTTVVGRTLATTVAQSVARTKGLIRALSISQGQSASFNRGLARGLNSAQGQSASVLGGVTRAPVVLALSQPQAVLLSKTPLRNLAASATTQASLDHPSLTRTLLVSQGQTPHLARAQTRSFTLTQSSVSALVRTPARNLSATQGATVVLSRAPKRVLFVAQGSVASLIGVVPFFPGRLSSTVEYQHMASDTAAGISSSTSSVIVTSSNETSIASSVEPVVAVKSGVE